MITKTYKITYTDQEKNQTNDVCDRPGHTWELETIDETREALETVASEECSAHIAGAKYATVGDPIYSEDMMHYYRIDVATYHDDTPVGSDGDLELSVYIDYRYPTSSTVYLRQHGSGSGDDIPMEMPSDNTDIIGLSIDVMAIRGVAEALSAEGLSNEAGYILDWVREYEQAGGTVDDIDELAAWMNTTWSSPEDVSWDLLEIISKKLNLEIDTDGYSDTWIRDPDTGDEIVVDGERFTVNHI